MTHADTASANLEPATIDRLGTWLSEQSPQLPRFQGPIVSTSLISGGRSNLTSELVDSAGQRFILRRPPGGGHQGNAHDMLREARTIAAVSKAGVAAPEVIAQTDDSSVIGVPFFVMSFVDGHVLATADAARTLGIAWHPSRARRVAQSLAGALAAIHALDIDAAGLSDMRRRGSYVERQLRRFTGSVSRLPASEERDRQVKLGETLSAAAPAEQSVGLLHGDYKLGNVIVRADGSVAAVLDWELASTGDPAADVGWLVASWAQPGDGRWLVPPATVAGGFPSRDEIAGMYAEAAGLPGSSVQHLDFYVAFAYWRWSAINLGTRQRNRDGTGSGSPIDLDALNDQIHWQLDRVADYSAH
jgi:aminoglycoside phosphotransferase (APT) family kinase protein